MPRNIYAYTAPGADFPEFISVNERIDDQGNKSVVITARGTKVNGGATVDVALTRDEAMRLYASLQAWVAPSDQA